MMDPPTSSSTERPSRPLPIVVLISGRGSNLQSLIDAITERRLDARIECVISNRANAAGLDRAQRAGIHCEVVSHRDFADRASFDRALGAIIDRYHPALIVLAGFMRVLGEELVDRYLGRLINIHPSLLPAFPGLDTHQRAIDAGVPEHGASVHFVTRELDGGPVIAQARVPVHDGDDADTLAARVLEQEHKLLPDVVQRYADGRVILRDGRVHHSA